MNVWGEEERGKKWRATGGKMLSAAYQRSENVVYFSFFIFFCQCIFSLLFLRIFLFFWSKYREDIIFRFDSEKMTATMKKKRRKRVEPEKVNTKGWDGKNENESTAYTRAHPVTRLFFWCLKKGTLLSKTRGENLRLGSRAVERRGALGGNAPNQNEAVNGKRAHLEDETGRVMRVWSWKFEKCSLEKATKTKKYVQISIFQNLK